MREEDMANTEELKMNHLSVEEVAARRAEVRKMRELMFRAEIKAKRVAKIKSKTYRRVKKKERASLRHKNTGKWAKAMKGRHELDEDQRKDITEMLDRGERLRRKIHGEK